MRSESVAVNFLLVSIVLQWTGVLCAEPPNVPLNQGTRQEPTDIQATSLPQAPSPALDPDVESLINLCKCYGPVHFNTFDRNDLTKVLDVLTTLRRLFENLTYFDEFESDEVLAYYPLLSELSFLKERYPNKIMNMLITWPLPKGNLGLSLLISTAPISESTLVSLVSYLPHASNFARLAATNHCLDAFAPNSVSLPDNYDIYRLLCSTFDPSVVRGLKRTLYQSEDIRIIIASSLLHFADAYLDEVLIKTMNDALTEFTTTTDAIVPHAFCNAFARHPTILRDPVSMQPIFDRNKFKFQNIQFSDKQRAALSALNKIKFGTSQDIADMSEAERNALMERFEFGPPVPLVFNIWAREDVRAGVWGRFANDPFNTRILYKLAFDLKGFFQNHFSVDLFEDEGFRSFLEEFKYYPSSSKKEVFHELLQIKVKERHATVLALLWNRRHFKCLLNFFIDQEDKEGLKALNDLVFMQIDGAPLAEQDHHLFSKDIIRVCQILGGRIDGGCINDPLQLLAERVGAAKVLRYLDFSLLWAYDVEGILSTLGIPWEQMDAALSSFGRRAAVDDKVGEVLREFNDRDRFLFGYSLPEHHALWFYLWETHHMAFIKYVHLNIQSYYPSEQPSHYVTDLIS